MPDHFGEVVDLARFGFRDVAVDELAVAEVIHPRSTLPVPRVENVPVPAEGDLVLVIEVESHRLEERRSVADVDQVLPSLEADDRNHVHVGSGHVGAAKIDVVAAVS